MAKPRAARPLAEIPDLPDEVLVNGQPHGRARFCGVGGLTAAEVNLKYPNRS